MPTSPSSMTNQHTLDDEPDKDLFVAVDDPQQHATPMETYFTYRILTKVKDKLITQVCGSCIEFSKLTT